jgi:hypothetical protein
VSEECCQGEEYSPVAEVEEVDYTTGILRTRVPIVWKEGEDETVESRMAPDAPSRNHIRPAPVNVHARVGRAGGVYCPRIVRAVQAMMRGWT